MSDFNIAQVRKTTLHDETKREDCNWFAPIYVVDDCPFREIPTAEQVAHFIKYWDEYDPG